MFAELREGKPASRVHVEMRFVVNVFLIDLIDSNSLGTPSGVNGARSASFLNNKCGVRKRNVPSTQHGHEFRLELGAVAFYVLPGTLSNY